ncbi:MAG TPA: bifunctional UDP-N-acetylglucosamine diphosphorylase/glucosamine-1-phosphate N-acetyltransferase GlmU [Kofleriaceae bacterium]|nr:bifunctional UDP-N-acetylglucosamine diphosphorylase/glucosamine-1-phosphate N-acetyltransferase GlmU [Kofleriaceae bacterium]
MTTPYTTAPDIALVLAAGLGTRMHSATVKVLHEVAGKPLIAWAVDAAIDAGARRVVAVLGHQRERVDEFLASRYGGKATVEVAVQAEPRGTGDAVRAALPAMTGEPDEAVVAILYGDAPLVTEGLLASLCAACQRSPAGMAVTATEPPHPVAYGRLVRDSRGRLARIVEHVDATDDERAIAEVNAGIYAIRLGRLREDLRHLSADNAQGEIYLTDLAARAAARGGAEVVRAPWEEVMGINDRVDLAAVARCARRRINEAWMIAGVTMEAPEATYIDADCGPLGADVWLGPGVCLRGQTRIGDGARIDAGCVLTDVVVEAGATIKPSSVLSEATIGTAAQVGPFSHCRPGTVIDERARIGNFVETKKSHIMAGAKANHLAYLGDASVGAGANIGAGTITCNYDGVKKHRTVIESGAFIGSDSQLIAPVTVGRDAYVGSGTTVTRDVPRSSLALSRAKQVNIDGWADRFRDAQNRRQSRQSDPDGK